MAITVRRPDRRRLSTRRGPLLIVLATVLFSAVPIAPARSDGREDRLLSITKTTVYGALLGGILGFTSALVVRDGYEDDAVRWGIVLGAFGGFAYGIATPEEDDWDEFSMRLPRRLAETNLAPPPRLTAFQTLAGLTRSRRGLDSRLTGTVIRRNTEVHNGDLEKEVRIEEEDR